MNIKRLLPFAGVLILFIIFVLLASSRPRKVIPPPTITNNIVDLAKVKEISKFRSCAGHVVVPTTSEERKRNMKHYFHFKDEYQNLDEGVPVYAPFSGMIVSIHNIEDKIGDEEISFLGEEEFSFFGVQNDWGLGILHLDVLDTLKEGDEVEGGQLVGYAKQNGFDVVFATYASPQEQKVIEGWYCPYRELDSIFNHMSDQVFKEYLDAGVGSKEEIVLTKEQRDADPCLYRDSAPDLEHPNDREDNWIKLN